MESKKLNILEKISLWWKFDGRYYHKDFVRGVKNLWKWFPVIWKDRDWDDHYIFEVLKFKINKQADYIGDRNIHVSAKRDAEIMRLVNRLIKLNQDEFYSMEYMDYHETKYDFIPTDKTEKWFTMADELISERFDDYFKKYPRQYKLVMSGKLNFYGKPMDVTDKKIVAMTIAHANQERCHKLLFDILKDNIRRWWD
jgi:hypothetical protein